MMNRNKETIIQRIEELTVLLGGNVEKITRRNSYGKSSKVIQIEYDVEI